MASVFEDADPDVASALTPGEAGDEPDEPDEPDDDTDAVSDVDVIGAALEPQPTSDAAASTKPASGMRTVREMFMSKDLSCVEAIQQASGDGDDCVEPGASCRVVEKNLELPVASGR